MGRELPQQINKVTGGTEGEQRRQEVIHLMQRHTQVRQKEKTQVIHDSNTKPEKPSPESALNFIGIDPIPRATFHLAVCFKRVVCVLCECTEWAVRRQKNKGPLHS